MDKDDKRVEFLQNSTLTLLRLKRDKWQKFITAEQNLTIIRDFFEQLDFCNLFISLNAASNLVATLNFPLTFKTTTVYFVKKENVAINNDNIRNLFVGNFVSLPVNAVANVDEVNHSMHMKKQDMKINLRPEVSLQAHVLRNEVYVVRDHLKGRIFLPLPEDANSVEKTVYRQSHCIDSTLLHAFETVIIDWTHRVAKVLSTVSAQPIIDGLNPLPKAEFAFWCNGLMDLDYVNEQLMNPKVLKMAEILEMSESCFMPALRNIYKDVKEELREATDIVIFLKPLQKSLDEIEQLEYYLLPSFTKAMMHTVALIWANSEYYSHPENIIVILQEICNLFIDMTRNFLCPDEVMKGLEGEIDETIGKIKMSIETLVTLRASYDQCKLDMDKYFKNGPTKKWDFPSDLVFTRLNAFLQRLRNIEEVYETTFEFLKLEKLVFQGIRGGVLGASSLPIHENFIKSIKMLAECKYDPIDISDKSFEMDFKEFQTHITDCERRIGTIFCQAFDYCAFPESATKLFEMFGFVLKRPLLQSLISSKYKKLLEMFSVELDRIKRIYDAHMITLEICHGARPVAKNMPPIAGQLKWAKELKERLQIQMKSIRAIHHMYMGSDEVKCVCQKSDEMMELLHNFCDSIYTQWSAKVDTDCKLNLAQPLLLRKQKNFLKVNFNKQLVAVMREVKYLTMLDQDAIPPCAADIFAKHETFQKYVASLYLIVSVYNQVQAALLPVEFSLMKEELMNIDEELACAEYSLCWSSEGIWEYIQKMSDTIQDVQSRIELAKSNVKTMQDIMNDWIVTRMFERKDSKIDSLLDLEGTSVALQKKYSSISETGKKIDALITENKVIFRANECSESWIKYTDYIDDKVLDGFYKVIYVSLNFLLKNMSAEAKHPLFEVCFALEDGNTAFHPSMSYGISDGFYYLIENLIYDVYSTATLIPRISMTNRISYMVELEEMSELTNMRKELMTQVLNGMKDAQDYHEVLFMKYGYLWKDDHDKVMELFLMYGKLFKHDDIVANRYESIPIKPPTLKEFKEAIDTYEELYTEVKKLKNTKILQHWLQVDFRPFKHTLLNIIKNGAGCLSKILLMVLLIGIV